MRTERAQWRGLDFDWLNESHSGSNRLAIHKYVDRDTHSVKPIGCDEERWTVRGYICDDRLRDAVREFRDAFKRRGPGRLYDPWQNEDFDVYVESWSISPTKNILGVEFTASFVEAGEEPYAIATLSPLAAFADAIEQLEEDAETAFADTFGVINERATSVGSAISDVNNTWGYLTDSARFGLGYGIQIDLSAPDAFAVVNASHYDVLLAVFNAVDELYTDAAALAFYIRNLYLDLGFSDPNLAGAAAAQENRTALEALIARTSFARIAAIIINRGYATREHAQQAVDELREYAQALLRFEGLCEDAAVSRDVQCILAIAAQVPLGLSPLKIWTATTRQSALVLAHDIYCDIDRAGELADLNNALTSMPPAPCYAAN